MSEGGKKAQTSSYQRNTSWQSNVRHGNDSYRYHIIYLKDVERIDLDIL